MDFDQILQNAVENARDRAVQNARENARTNARRLADANRAEDFLLTWHQHQATKMAVFREFELLVAGRRGDEKNRLLNEFNEQYGTEAPLYHG